MQPFYKACRGLGYGLLTTICTLGAEGASAQNPVYKIDLNQAGRPEAEVHEPGYLNWALASNVVDTARFSLNGGVQISLIRKKPYGDKLSTNWYKAGIQTPFFARLVCDGVRVNNGNGGAQIEMRISGLPAGRHSLLTYHNNVDALTPGAAAPIDIYMNGVKKYDNLVLSIRETVTANVPTAYMYADAVPGQDVVALFVADSTTGASIRNFMINAIEINTANPKYQAQTPFPANADEHVNADQGSATLSWTNAANAVASRIYFGTDSTSVANATTASPLYKGRQSGTSFTATSQYSMNTYYWRVDQEDAEGNVTHGNVWYYRPRQLAFRDAEGYGQFARGGRGGKVVHVTNLNDAGPGSLREAVSNDIGPRTIVFDVSGIITLKSRLTLGSNYVTVAGQTAPGKGICIKGAPFGCGGKDDIIRHMRVRVGSGPTYDGMGLNGDHSIMDNCSISWTIDEAFSSRGAKNITLQRTLISEALNVANHQNYPAGTAHGYAATIGGTIGSFHHNLLAHCEGRNWSLGGGLDGNGFYSGKLDIRNNVVYNWRGRTTDGGANEVNFVGNYYKRGAATTKQVAFTLNHEGVGKGMQRCYFAGNVMPGRFDETNQSVGRNSTISGGEIVNYETFVDQPFAFGGNIATQSAREAYKRVLSNVGANQPVFDEHDIRVVTETHDSTFTYRGSKTNYPGLPDSHTDVGGWEEYPELRRAADWDTDGDGLPDWWERLKKLNVNSLAGDFSDSNADADHDGFTNLDDYLEFMGGDHQVTAAGKKVTIDLKQLTRGYSKSPVFTIDNEVNGTATMTPAKPGIVEFLTPHQGLASFTFTVTDAEGSSMTRTVHIAAVPAAVPAQPGSLEGNNRVCPGSEETYSIPVVANTVSYQWTVPANASIVSGQGTNSVKVQFAPGFSNGLIQVQALNFAGGSVGRNLFLQTTAKPAIPASITSSTAPVCPGEVRSFSAAPVDGATAYQWTLPEGARINSGAGTATVEIEFLNSFTKGLVTVAAVNCSGTGVSRNLYVALPAKPYAPGNIIGQSNPACGTQVWYKAAAVNTALSYQWTLPAGLVAVSGETTNSILVSVQDGYNGGILGITALNCAGSSTAQTKVLGGSCGAAGSLARNGAEESSTGVLNVTAYPNPSSTSFQLQLRGGSGKAVTLKVTDALGNVVEQHGNVAANGSLTIGSALGKGLYLLEVIQGGERQTIKLLKQ
ncbi:T9SS type A sorting domain-containing protein [Paraflavisolibacter sp. H34]|uniref:T9SS type A sorting domain-containing protein n=1 Tax=Huijunlia imazamoxiresistens TaxID=3127457 RepID=UPI00301709F0